MQVVHLESRIHAPVQRVFDLARNMDLHGECYRATNERAVAGVTSGLIGEGETVTFKYSVVGFRYHYTVRVSDVDSPRFFRDCMVEGTVFSRFEHEHGFIATSPSETLMTDRFEFELQGPSLYRTLADPLVALIVKRSFITRSNVMRRCAESSDWKRFLSTAESEGDSHGHS